MIALVLVVPWVLFAPTSRAGNICYFPNGLTSTDVPCNPDAAVTQCCGTRSACLSNGLCALENTDSTSGSSYARGTCTDRSWASPLCPQQCQLNQDTPNNSSAYDFRAGGVQVWQCGGTQGYGQDAEFCCESQAEKMRCCSTTNAVFSLSAATVGPSTRVPISLTYSTTLSASGDTGAATPIFTAPATRTGRPAEQTSAAPEPSSDGAAVKIGAGVGGAVGGLLLAVLIVGFILWRRRRGANGAYQQKISSKSEMFEHNAPVEIQTSGQKYEVAGRQRHELGAKEMPAEMPVSGAVWELPSEDVKR